LKQINEWRKALGTEIHKYRPKIDEQQLNDVVQSYLNRVLFLRVCEDRNLEDYQTLLKFANANDFKSLIKKFEQADKRYNSGLFDQLLKDKIIENISSVFWTIINIFITLKVLILLVSFHQMFWEVFMKFSFLKN
jgi:hypothetical protein